MLIDAREHSDQTKTFIEGYQYQKDISVSSERYGEKKLQVN